MISNTLVGESLMTTRAYLLADAFDRVKQGVVRALDGLDQGQLAARLDEDANSIAWLVWHLTRVQDQHVSELAARPQAWLEEGWYERFVLPFAPSATGFGQRSDEVERLGTVSAALLRGYHEAVYDRTLDYLAEIDDEEIVRVIDRSWVPEVTVGMRLVSVISDDMQHIGQASYVRGILMRATGAERKGCRA